MQNGIRFDRCGETIAFAQNLSENESYELVQQMRLVCPFQFQIPRTKNLLPPKRTGDSSNEARSISPPTNQ